MTTYLPILTTTFIFILGLGVLAVIAMFVIDITQTSDAVRRNYPVIGRFRHVFTELGEFFRQYFFAMDREEMPFNRAERDWIGRAAKGEDNTVAFGSSKMLSVPGTPIFVNCPFPTLDEDAHEVQPLLIGPHCKTPYSAPSFFNISAMSYGALSTPAVRALSKGAKLAGCWMNTGEGGLSPYHLEGGADVVFQIGTAKYGVRDEAGNLSDAKLKEALRQRHIASEELEEMLRSSPLWYGDALEVLYEEYANEELEDELEMQKAKWKETRAKAHAAKDASYVAAFGPAAAIPPLPNRKKPIPDTGMGISQKDAKQYLPPSCNISKQEEWHMRWRISAPYLVERSKVFERGNSAEDMKALKWCLSLAWSEYTSISGKVCPWILS